MNEELKQLYTLTDEADFSDEVKEDLKIFFSGLDDEEVSGILDLCTKDERNLLVVAEVLEKRKEALIQDDPETWEQVLSFEKNLVDEEESGGEDEEDDW